MENKNTKPFSTYILVWLGLVMLTIITVTVASMHLGNLSILGAVVIAIIKSSLVVSIFMNIKYEDKVFKYMVGVAVITLAIIISLTFFDISYR